jgi:hypothetical protein
MAATGTITQMSVYSTEGRIRLDQVVTYEERGVDVEGQLLVDSVVVRSTDLMGVPPWTSCS